MTESLPPKKPFHVAVCGGGIGGICLTIGLLRQNISCTLYESAPAFSEIGAGVSFGPNAVRAMALLDPAIAEAYTKCATWNAWEANRGVWFDFRLGMREDAWKGTLAPGREEQLVARVKTGGLGMSSTHRAHFLDEMVRLIPDGVAQFGKRVHEVKEINGKMEITFADKSTVVTDAVIGCDGVKSRTRQILLGEDHPMTRPTFTGKYAYRGLVPMDKAVEAIGEEFARNSQQWMGQHGHVLNFPIEKGKTMNVVAFHTKAEGKWENEQWVLPMRKEDMFHDFSGWGGKVQKILSLMEKPDVWALFDHPPAPTYYRGNFALLGDAAHASTPHQGAGAGQAVEDAYLLSALLGLLKAPSEIESALYAYDAIRRPRSQKVVRTSREAAALYDFEDQGLEFDLKRVEERLSIRYEWIWHEDLEAQLERAKALL